MAERVVGEILEIEGIINLGHEKEDGNFVLQNEGHFHALVNTVMNLQIARYDFLKVILINI